ncbi:undecaprenyl-diphosphatase [Paenibacillus bovis]|uniref:Undecaprenyl-diphosphatase n=1 Tax=Paenibacillus bovis TaxID=1616788 RepID=A0A172ZGX6_9BACL|nr:undecaprenyl-diphosphatase [Paenibacillus bovis]ANF96838.1 undecaprenyl-diphosphatase [Paenibacillus bovis]
MSELDYEIFHWINGGAGYATFWNPLMIFLSKYAVLLFMIGAVVYWFTRARANRRMITEALVSAAIGVTVNWVLGELFYRDRPFVNHEVIQLVHHEANASFPSTHSLGSFVIAMTIWQFRRRDGWMWLVLAAGIALSRVWTGVHYPGDVLAGACIGILVSVLVHRLFTRISLANSLMELGIYGYERLEMKIWPRSRRRSRHHSMHR